MEGHPPTVLCRALKRPTLFKDLLKSDVTCSLDRVTINCIIDSQCYLIDFKGVEPARLVLQDGQEISRDSSSSS